MPPRRGRSTPKPKVTLGFAGSGELSAEAIGALLDDTFDQETEFNAIYIPATKDTFTPAMEAVAAWCREVDLPYEVVSDAASEKDRKIKKAIDGTEDPSNYWEAGPDAAAAVVELLTSTEDQPLEDARLLMFFDAESDADIDAWEKATEAGVLSFDMCEELSAITGEDGEEEEPEPEEEKPARRGRRGAAKEEPEEEKPARGRRGAAKKAEPEEDEQGEDEQEEGSGEDIELGAAEQTRYASLIKLGLTELKRLLKEVDTTVTTAQLRGKTKEELAQAVVVAERAASDEGGPAEEAADEGQTDAEGRSRGEQDADTREEVYARLRASREVGERIAAGMVAAVRAAAAEEDPEQRLERASGAVAGALMLFAELIITEVRKPKSPGRPRSDGSEAQPRQPVDPDAPKRPRGRPRKDAS